MDAPNMPFWIEILLASSATEASFKEWLEDEDARLIVEMQSAITTNEIHKAQIATGQRVFLNKLAQAVVMHKIEQQQQAEQPVA